MKTVFALVLTGLLAGCDVAPREVGEKEFDPKKIAYFIDYRTELCFAVVSYSRVDARGSAAGGLSHSVVPCSPAVLKLIR